MDIDIVVLWVDGNDPAWIAEKDKYAPKKEDKHNAKNRFRDWGLMPYWFRAVEKFMPWVRRIHFVTWGHVPPFLNLNHPKLHIVCHEDFMPPETLPTFNSCSLEMNLHRIEGLAERFIYFNDDLFITRPMNADDFFEEKSGLPRAHFAEMPCYLKGTLSPHEIAIARDIAILNKWFPKKDIPVRKYFGLYCSKKYPLSDNVRTLVLKVLFPTYYGGFRYFHNASPLRKSTYAEVWEKEPDILWNTSMQKFRNNECFNQYLLLWWQEASGQFAPCRVSSAVSDIIDSRLDQLCDMIEHQCKDMICLNDSTEYVDFEKASGRLRASFECILPEKSSFEL